jgi:hypothetical protein
MCWLIKFQDLHRLAVTKPGCLEHPRKVKLNAAPHSWSTNEEQDALKIQSLHHNRNEVAIDKMPQAKKNSKDKYAPHSAENPTS